MAHEGFGGVCLFCGKGEAGRPDESPVRTLHWGQWGILTLLGKNWVGEVQCSSGYGQGLTGGDAVFSDRGIDTGVNGEVLLHGQMGLVLPGQIEIGVQGGIKDRIPVKGSLINDRKALPLRPVSGRDVSRAGETLVTMGRGQTQGDGRPGVGLYSPTP